MNSSIAVSIALLLLSAGAIYLACEYFVNGIEWVGRKTGVAETAVGSILAAFGTALPESAVTFIAVVFGKDDASKSIGVGAALGGPLVLATIAYAVVGAALLYANPKAARLQIDLNAARLSRDQGWFLLIFVLKLALGFLVFAAKPWLGVLFLLAYAAYFWTEMRREEAGESEALEPLKLQAKAIDPSLAAAVLQTSLALAAIFAASHLFVGQLGAIGPWLGISPAIVALFLSPIATELPEIMNAIIWIKQGKHRLALANISGAMMIQATIPSALGLFFTPWLFDSVLGLAGIITLCSVLGLFILLRRKALTPLRLVMFGGFYLVFGLGVALLHH